VAAISVTYEPSLSRLRIEATGLAAGAVTATVERSIEGVAIWSTVRGGTSVAVTGSACHLDDYEFPADPGADLNYRVTAYNAGGVQVDQVTAVDVAAPALTSAWLKVPAAPFLNRPVVVADRSNITRRARQGVFDVVGRTFPVVVGDVASGLAFSLQLLTETAAEERDLDYLFTSGEIVFVQLPAGVEHFPTGYYAVGNTSREPTLRLSPRRLWDVPLTETAAPGVDVVGSAYTIASMLAEYATVAAVLADNASIADLLERTGAPSDVIVP
jgi:hypothetical protein